MTEPVDPHLSPAQRLIREFGYWGEHPAYPVDQWKYQITNGDTRESYWEWVSARVTEDDTLDMSENDYPLITPRSAAHAFTVVALVAVDPYEHHDLDGGTGPAPAV